MNTFPMLAEKLAFAAFRSRSNILVILYAAFFILFSTDVFANLDFMFTLFLAVSSCILLSFVARGISGMWSNAFIMLQVVSISNYFCFGVLYISDSYSQLMGVLHGFNSLLCFADIMVLFGIAYGDSQRG